MMHINPSSSDSTITAVFDLDGTLLNTDSTASIIIPLVRRSRYKSLIASVVLPIVLPMFRSKYWHKLASSTLITLGFWGKHAEHEVCAFIERFMAKKTKLAWHQQGLQQLDWHLAQGHRVIIITGASALVAKPLVATLQRPITLLCTDITQWRSFFWIKRYCRFREKVNILAEQGILPKWHYAYTDSFDDYQLLKHAEQAFLINAKAKTINAFAQKNIALQALKWHT